MVVECGPSGQEEYKAQDFCGFQKSQLGYLYE